MISLVFIICSPHVRYVKRVSYIGLLSLNGPCYHSNNTNSFLKGETLMSKLEFVLLWLQLTEEIKNQIDEILGDSQQHPESEEVNSCTARKAS